MPDYHEVLNSAFPESTYNNTIRAIRGGIALGDEAVKVLPFLDTPVGKDFRGLMRRAAVMFRLHEFCKAGDLPFATEFSSMPIGSWHWLEIRSGQCHGYLVRTQDKVEFPKDTPNEQDKRHSNQADLFSDPKVVELPQAKIYTTWLCYGATKNGALTHALWGVPSGVSDETWLTRRDVLNFVLTSVVNPPESSKRPTVDPRQAMRLRDEIAHSLEQHEKRGVQSAEDDE